MNTKKYSPDDIARQSGVPVCLVRYYMHIGVLGVQEQSLSNGSPQGLELVDTEQFIHCATAAGLSQEKIICLLSLNDCVDEPALQLAKQTMIELIERQRAIAEMQGHLEAWIFEHCVKTPNRF